MMLPSPWALAALLALEPRCCVACRRVFDLAHPHWICPADFPDGILTSAARDAWRVIDVRAP